MKNTKMSVFSDGNIVSSKLKFGLVMMMLFISSVMLNGHAANAQTSKGSLGLGLVIGDNTEAPP